jgi:mono/diheme cytochrome c family protein
MSTRRFSNPLLIVFSILVFGCGSEGEFDPNESASTRAIREKVQAQMEIERLQQVGTRLAQLNVALAEAPTAVVRGGSDEGAGGESGEADGGELAGIERGGMLYGRNCASCHGATGGGDGPVAKSLVPQPARHDDGAYMNALSNQHLTKVIKEGGASVGKSTMMAPWGGPLSDSEIRDVVEFVRTLAVPAYSGSMP